MMPAGIVVFALATGTVHFVALLDYPGQLLDKAFRPAAGEARIVLPRERLVGEYFADGVPDLGKLAALVSDAGVRLALSPDVCLKGIDR